MKLLVITQTMDKDDPALGFFHEWVKEFAMKFEAITTICLQKGACDLPSNVKVLSLGKESGVSRLKYLSSFYKYIWKERKNYDAVFVHMNQEYVILGWKIWWILRKPIYMWRNHHSGDLFTDIAALFCKKVFCTSKYSYTAQYKKTEIMPIGVNLEIFHPTSGVQRIPKSILFLGRIAPVKRPDLFISTLCDIKDEQWSATIIGNALSKDGKFYEGLRGQVLSAGLGDRIIFQKGISNTSTTSVYSAHDIFINLSTSGMYDKTIIEAMACGCIVLASNENLRGEVSDDFIFKMGDKEELRQKLLNILSYSSEIREEAEKSQRDFAKKHDIKALVDKLYLTINK